MLLKLLLKSLFTNFLFYYQDVREHIDDVRDRENEIGGFQAFVPPQIVTKLSPQTIIITKIIIL